MMTYKLAPIVLFVFSRPDHTLKTLNALKENFLASESDLIIYSDSSRNSNEEDSVRKVRSILKNISGFKTVTVIEQEINQGLAKSIIDGVSDACSKYGKVIVLEDDIVTNKYFLTYMNEALSTYKDDLKVWHISGWNYPVKADSCGESFFWNTMNCWGWATWGNRWDYFEKKPNEMNWSDEEIFRFNLDGIENFWSQVEDNQSNKINTWAIFWYASIFKNAGLCLNPVLSLVNNIGVDGTGENSGSNDDFSVGYDANCISPKFPSKIEVNKNMVFVIKQYLRRRKSMTYKIKNKLMKILKK
jgi:galactitol-specific phosphotransferase system IIB component